MKRKFFGHNFGVVYRFEVVRMLKKKSFWAALLAFPVLISFILGIVIWSNSAAEQASEDLSQQTFSLGVTDQSGMILPELLKQLDAEKIATRDQGIEKVKEGKIDAFFFYPKDLTKEKVQVFGQNVGIFQNFKYQSVADQLLRNSALMQIEPSLIAVVSGNVQTETTTFQDGKRYDPIMEMIAPGIFIVLFFLIIATFGGQMMNSSVEEKENRVIEMLLTTIRARTLVIGKIFAQLTLVLIQVGVLLALAIAAYLLLRGHLDLPNFDLAQIPFDWGRIAIGFLIFFFSLLLFTGILVGIGAAVPTAREANNFLAAPILLIIGPIYAVSVFITNPEASVSTFLTLFPLTAPMPMMIRNAAGNLTGWETAVGLVILAVTAVIVFIIAARLFQTGAVEYSKRMSLKGLFKKSV